MSGKLIKINLPNIKQEVSLGQQWFDKRDELLVNAKKFTAINSANADDVGEMAQKLKKLASKIEKERLAITAPFRAAQKTIKGVVDKEVSPVKAEASRLDGMIGKFARAERIRIAEEEEAREQKRLEAEAEAAEQAAAEAELFGEPEEEDVEVVEVVQPEFVPQKPIIEGVRLSESVGFQVVDEASVPRQFLSVDESKIRAWKKSREKELIEQMKSKSFVQPISGVVLSIESKVASR